MELFSFIGLSNAEILAGAAAVTASAVALSFASRLVKGRTSSANMEKRIDRLEVRLAAAQSYQPTLQMADEVLKDVSTHAVAPLISIVEASAAPRSWFSKTEEPTETAAALASDLKDNVELASAIAKPIQNMLDNGAVEIAAERVKLAAETKLLAVQLGSSTWDKHRRTILTAGVPDVMTSRVIDCFTQVQNLKLAASSLAKKPSTDDLIEVLRRSAEVVTAASQSVDAFKHEAAE
jgi:hypothetical protein